MDLVRNGMMLVPEVRRRKQMCFDRAYSGKKVQLHGGGKKKQNTLHEEISTLKGSYLKNYIFFHELPGSVKVVKILGLWLSLPSMKR